MNGLSPSDYVLSAFSDIHANALEQTLLVCLGFTFYSILFYTEIFGMADYFLLALSIPMVVDIMIEVTFV